MRVRSSREVVSIEDGVVQIAFDLKGSKAGYLLISLPEAGAETAIDFFGEDHYVELQDQFYGSYGGLSRLRLDGDRRLEITLRYETPQVGSRLVIDTAAPLSGLALDGLKRLTR